ncbi:hypothetical protein [Hydrogenovibrio halophilus]|uniref:hypothetical protein n=1 Tax=Hydrogenovibrio halophilus TaxID=373391 RepID=UPI00036D9F36|nr:hypothetical protein [Hydrogenovibrio halophilus]
MTLNIRQAQAANFMLIRYMLFWFLLAIVATLNGVLRETIYGHHLSELAAHQISTGTGILFTGLLVWKLNQRWPIESSKQAWRIGLIWLLATIAFEFGFGHYIAGHTWGKLLADYQLLDGRIWLLFLIWIAVMPYVFYRLDSNRLINHRNASSNGG